MLVSSESLIPIIITLAAAAVGLCYLPIVMDVVAAITERQRKRRSVRQSAEQLEQKVLASHREILDEIEKQAKPLSKKQKKKLKPVTKTALIPHSRKLKRQPVPILTKPTSLLRVWWQRPRSGLMTN